MPRNDQITRQWYLLRLLEGSPGKSLQDLVDNVPDDYPKNARTVRRDLEALEAVGFPLVVERRNGQTSWRLMEGFRDIPALGFSATELMALLFSRNLLKPLEGTEIAESLNSALNKASAALPPQGHEYLRAMEQMFSVGIGPHKNFRQHRQTIDLISLAIDKRRTAQMRYFSASRGNTARREVDPYYLRFAGGGLYLIGHCHLRQEVRMFAVERIRSITLTDHPYQMPFDFKVDEYVQDALGIMRSGRRIDVELLFSKKAGAWVKDKNWHPSQETKLLKDGRLRMTLKVADNEELVGWILSFGGQVKVVRPDTLRQNVLDEAKNVLKSSFDG
ncbi:MAG TPA: WYL domain-containing protein [Candidatus Binatia bacterium]|jgi:predicted DNA-binding transcriptional regulator YafY|nr:WYL domain-containing protein [Candidatus Binatia bacterium]